MLAPDQLAAMKTRDPVAGPYGLGLFSVPTSCGEAWGHDGAVPDYLAHAYSNGTASSSCSSTGSRSTSVSSRRQPRARRGLLRMRNEVRDLRTAGGLSQQQLAEAMEVSRQTINSIEKERYTPSLPLAMALARYFEKTVEEVFHADT